MTIHIPPCTGELCHCGGWKSQKDKSFNEAVDLILKIAKKMGVVMHHDSGPCIDLEEFKEKLESLKK